jgi:prephenate dehydratase
MSRTALRIGYLGPPGTFGEQAAILFDSSAELFPFPTHAAIIQAVSNQEADLGVVAVENSLEGAVNETIDQLLLADTLSIRSELVISVEQNLIAGPDTDLTEIDKVISHPQALAQCRGWLEAILPGIRIEAALSTAGAVAEAVRTPRLAAIGPRRAAEVHGGEMLAEAIQDVRENKTRFLVVGDEDALPTGADKTSIAFTVPHDRPGTLLGALRELADRGINLTHIESRPSREQLGIYVFFIDFDGHRSEPVAADALEAIRKQANLFRVLGSYPRFSEEA